MSPVELAGMPQDLPRIRHVLAPNPSSLTYRGTNSYILGSGRVAIIDPGPDDPTHLAALLDALSPTETVEAILVTHAHLDHSALASRLSAATGAPIHALGGATAGRSPLMTRMAKAGLTSTGDGLDHRFHVDCLMADGDSLSGSDWQVTALHTPGHLGNHLCFSVGDILFSGDHVMGWSTSIVSPPEGDMGAYMASLAALSGKAWRVFLPGHGDPILSPEIRIQTLMKHRRTREEQILDILAAGPADTSTLTDAIYTDLPTNLRPAARRNVLAHLLDLLEQNRVATKDPTDPTATFERS